MRSWTTLRELLFKIKQTSKEITTFATLLIICMFVFTLLGMELYGHKVRFDLDNNVLADNKSEGMAPRPNFDSFYMAFTTIFIVFIGEDWHTVMHNYYRVEGLSAVLFFPTLFVVLHLILLNLFLAILLHHFETTDEEQYARDREDKFCNN